MQTTWFWLLCGLWSLYFLTEGFDFGVGMLLPVLGRSDDDRSTMIRSIGPFWDGNEVWLVIAGAATFAAFPVWYATMFSGFYIALLLLLVLLIVRVLSFEWRGKADAPGWRAAWTWLNTIAALGIPLIWGIALSSLLHGVPVSSEAEFTGSFWDLFTPYTVFAGISFVLLFALHGSVYLGLRTQGDLRERAMSTAARLAPFAALVGAAFLIWTLVVGIDRNDQDIFPGIVIVAVAAVAAVAAVVFARQHREGRAFVATAVTIVLAVVLLFTMLFPRVMVSSTDFAYSLTTSNASSGHYTLTVMSIFALVLLPIILLYQAWTYRVFRARLGLAEPIDSPADLLGPKRAEPTADA
jgi:cytochrome bd ubiquinol oxidase subunit II